jgi:hypothetical protein
VIVHFQVVFPCRECGKGFSSQEEADQHEHDQGTAFVMPLMRIGLFTDPNPVPKKMWILIRNTVQNVGESPKNFMIGRKFCKNV